MTRRPRVAPRALRGLTLVELVVTLALLGIVAVVGSRLLAGMAGSQRTGIDRLTAADAADAVVRRLGRELEGALPNSLRVTQRTVGGRVAAYAEFLPVLDGGRFRAAVDATASGPGDPLDTEDGSDGSFDVIGPPLGGALGGAQLVVHNLGNDLVDAWAGVNRRGGVVVTDGGTRVRFQPAGPFVAATDSRRFFLVDQAVTLGCEPVTDRDGRAAWQLVRRWNYGIHATQPTNPAAAPLAGAASALLLDGLSTCDIAYSTAMVDVGVVTLRLALHASGGAAGGSPLLVQLPLDNTP